MSIPELVKDWRHRAEEAEKAQQAYAVFDKSEAAKRMSILANTYRHCADKLDEAIGRKS